MNIGDFLKGLAMDAWYKALMYLDGAVFAASLFIGEDKLCRQTLLTYTRPKPALLNCLSPIDKERSLTT